MYASIGLGIYWRIHWQTLAPSMLISWFRTKADCIGYIVRRQHHHKGMSRLACITRAGSVCSA